MKTQTKQKLQLQFVSLSILLLMSISAAAAPSLDNRKTYSGRHSLKLRAYYFVPSEESFQDIYQKSIVLGGELNLKLWKSLYLWCIGHHFTQKGNLPITGDATKMTLSSAGGGFKFELHKGPITPYLGAGPVFYFYRENNSIGTAQGTKIGFIGQAGCHFSILKGFILDFCVNYSYCTVKPQSLEANLGGLQTGAGFGIIF